jgi:hypothetical protein
MRRRLVQTASPLPNSSRPDPMALSKSVILDGGPGNNLLIQ